jgi:hypothetical protein
MLPGCGIGSPPGRSCLSVYYENAHQTMTQPNNTAAAHSMLFLGCPGARGMYDVAMLILWSVGVTVISLLLLAYCYGLIF